MQFLLNKFTLDSNKTKLSSSFNLLDRIEQFWIGHFDISREIPAQVYHWHYGLVAFQLIPLVAGNSEFVLTCCEWTDVPRDIVTPSDGLNPVNAADEKKDN